MLEIGRAQRTAFVARYLRERDLQREIEEGLNVVESWNAANAVIYYGKGGEISTNRREEVEMGALCLRILQALLVYVNTLMLQDVLAEDAWTSTLTPADRRGLTPLFWSHVRPYGEVRTGRPGDRIHWRAIARATQHATVEEHRHYAEAEQRIPDLARQIAADPAYRSARTAPARKHRVRDFLMAQSEGYTPPGRLVDLVINALSGGGGVPGTAQMLPLGLTNIPANGFRDYLSEN